MKFEKIFLNEKIFFYLILTLNIIPALSLKFFLTLDGPAHLYNGNIIKNLIVGHSQVINSMYVFNNIITPNWSGHFILAVLSLIFNGFMTEKIFIILNLIFLPISFRYLIKIVSPSNRNLSYLIFPFTYSFLFQCGFFNFCISFVFMFLTLGYWYKNSVKPHIRHVIMFTILLTITFFSHILIFVFLVTILTLLMIVNCLKDYNNLKVFVISLLKKSTILFLAALPSIFFMIQFLLNVKFESTTEKYPLNELIKWIINVRPLVLFNFEKESLISSYFIFIYLTVFIYTIIFRIKKVLSKHSDSIGALSSLKYGLVVSDVILLFSILILTLFFILPNSASAGMMSDRLCVIFFIFFIFWIAVQSLKRWFYLIIVISTLVLHFLLLLQHYPSFKDLSNTANEIYKTSKHIKKESIVLSINWTDNWILGHSADYVGAEKPVILLNNYEPFYKWFPLRWKEDSFPNILFGDQQYIKDTWWYSNHNSSCTKIIDYIMIIGNSTLLNEPNKQELKAVIIKSYNLVYKSNNSFIVLYELKNNYFN